MFLFQFIIALHVTYAIVGSGVNSVLLYCMFKHTPEKFRVFGWLMRVHSLFDLIGTLAGFCAMQRIIPCGWSLLYISYGPCQLIGSFTCYLCYTITLFVCVITFYITLISFMARLEIVKNGAITAKRALLYLIVFATPAPIIFMVSFLISKSDDDVMKEIMEENFPNDEAYNVTRHTVTGNERLDTIPMGLVMFIVTGLITPLYMLILWLRHSILKVVNQANQSMSMKTKKMHRQFVSMLTMQAALPLILILAVVTFCMGQFHIYKHPLIESASIIFGETPALISPFIVFFHVTSYRKAFKKILGRKVSINSDAINSHSQDAARNANGTIVTQAV